MPWSSRNDSDNAAAAGLKSPRQTRPANHPTRYGQGDKVRRPSEEATSSPRPADEDPFFVSATATNQRSGFVG